MGSSLHRSKQVALDPAFVATMRIAQSFTIARLEGACVSACKSHPKRLRKVIDIWPDNVAVSPSLIRQAHVQTLPNIDERI